MSLPHKKGYATAEQAMRSKAFVTTQGAELDVSCPCGKVHVVPPKPLSVKSEPRTKRQPMRAVSAVRAAENRLRRKIVAQLWPDGMPQCEWPGCPRLADDVHEKLSRARGGSITERENLAALCREHHDYVTFTPESELEDAYALGLLVHSWNAPKDGEAA